MPGAGLTSRVGRRGLCLILVGIIWVVLGLGLVLNSPPAGGFAPAVFVPLPWLGAGWIVTGAVAVCFAPLTRDDTEGFAAVSVMPLGWGFGWLWTWVASLTPGGLTGSGDGWRAALVWAAVIAGLWLIASWPEPHADPDPNGRQW